MHCLGGHWRQETATYCPVNQRDSCRHGDGGILQIKEGYGKSVEQTRLWRCSAWRQCAGCSRSCLLFEVSEYPFDNCRVFDRGDHFDRATALGASFDIDIEHPLQPLGPRHGCPALCRCRVGFILSGRSFTPFASLSRRNIDSVFAVRGEYTVISTPSCS